MCNTICNIVCHKLEIFSVKFLLLVSMYKKFTQNYFHYFISPKLYIILYRNKISLDSKKQISFVRHINVVVFMSFSTGRELKLLSQLQFFNHISCYSTKISQKTQNLFLKQCSHHSLKLCVEGVLLNF
jgi:hypothetical protein